MNGNSVLRRLKIALNMDEPALLNVFKQSDVELDGAALSGFLKKEEEEGYAECDEVMMKKFLDGFITMKRGKKEEVPGQKKKPDGPLTNNAVLKKLRIALELEEEDLLGIFSTADVVLSASELSALYRAPGNKHYKECSDNMLKSFLQGLAELHQDKQYD